MSTHFVRESLIDPRIAPSAVPLGWRRALFPSPAIGVLSLALLALLVIFGWRFVQWAVVHAHWLGESSEACPGEIGACWAFVTARWKPLLGGFLLTFVVTLATFVTAFPIGLSLALGRRSRLPIVRWLCTAFIEGMRAVPLLAVLFIAATLLPLFLPTGYTMNLFWRAVVAFALFNAAMAAEVFRGGLQAVGHGQIEAATTVGLSDFASLRLIVLPQAITAVVPALANIMIAVIKETTLLSIVGVSDLLGSVEIGAKSPAWIGEPNILTSGYVFLAAIYLIVCYGLSRYSRRLEARR
ncbi:MAG TPA: amino acid ABC transporter permease [Casimicrobiaceae bacterium]|nr:amino acid ABC transporter permease [Casimicrobiaceae bacterium]